MDQIEFNSKDYIQDEKKLETFEALLRDYIPSNLIKDFEKAKIDLRKIRGFVSISEFLQKLLDKSNNQWRMYGSGEELAENLKIYSKFPLGNKKIGLPCLKAGTMRMGYSTRFRSLKGNDYMEKKEFVNSMCGNARVKYLEAMKETPAEVFDYLSGLERDLEECYEFVRNDMKFFDEFRKEVLKFDQEANRGFNYEDYEEMRRNAKPPKQEEIDEEMNLIKKFVSKYSDMFLPYSKSKNSKNPNIVRIFEDGDQKFVLEVELLRGSEVERPESNTMIEFVHTIELDEVFKKYRDQVKDIEFIRFPINRSKHAAVPIITPKTRHVILSSDALLQILRHMISGLQLFQTVKIENLSDLTEFLQFVFPTDCECIYLLNTKVLDELKRLANKFESKSEVKQVRAFNNFHHFNIKAELIRLGLETTIPEITEHSEAAHKEVYKNKKKEKLRTCDMVDAIEMCQIVCVLDRFPKLKTFLHTQKACHRVPLLSCEMCSGAEKVPKDDSKTQETPSESCRKCESLVKKCKNFAKISEKKDAIVEKSEELVEKTLAERNRLAEALQTTKQEQLEQLEKMAKQIQEFQKSRRDAEKLDKKNAKMNEEMKREIQKLKGENQRLKVKEKQMEQTELELRSSNEQKDRVIKSLQESADQQISASEHTRIVKGFQDTISILSDLNEEQGKAIHKLLARFASISTPVTPDCPVIQALQKIRDNLRENSPLKLAKEMVERLISLSTRPEIHQMARYEYEQYEGKVCVYLQELEVSIDKLNDKSSMTTPPIPSHFPSFSDRFINEYWMEIQKSRTEEGLDNECLICLVEMTPEQNTLECEHCKKVFHLECASQWLKVARTCSHCRQNQLDPNEFPALQ